MGIVATIGGVWTLGMLVIWAVCYAAGEADDAEARPGVVEARSSGQSHEVA